MQEQVIVPALQSGSVIQWVGIRRDESVARRQWPMFRKTRWQSEPPVYLVQYAPLIDWSVDDVFALHKKHGLAPNPLYEQGMTRVGCAPCIMSRKRELAVYATQYPEVYARLKEWEIEAAKTSRRGWTSFFAVDKTPKGRVALASDTYIDMIDEITDWAVGTVEGQGELRLDDDPCQAGHCE